MNFNYIKVNVHYGRTKQNNMNQQYYIGRGVFFKEKNNYLYNNPE